ncbi:pilus assembly protein [Nonomuraea sp. NN258]|uniref:TadE/TadG family type IV pilus assembly protein n=1 Tax=Nonomuraea antri TaxID=2730852 RepID=UPI001569FC8E|nr:TadE/TadG family type IV pilus assembly protein [Nonomuraea antri]NRQ32101.1 pilus assembly protein [Nonomuraea antri]
MRDPHAERGSSTAETTIIISVIALVLMFAVVVGRITVATAAVEAAARDAARQASMARTASEAEANAASSAEESLRSRGVSCEALAVDTETGGFAQEAGTPAVVVAHVSCTVPLEDVGFPGFGGGMVREASFTSPLDPYRGRQE